MSELKICRICKSQNLEDVIDIGEQYLTSRFPSNIKDSIPICPIVLSKCSDCGLVQLKNTISNFEMYEDMYGYRSGINQSMKTHLQNYAMEVLSKINFSENDYVLDIGCNDGTFLRNFSQTSNLFGIDPTAKQFLSYHNNLNIISNYFTYDNLYEKISKDIKFKIISSISMFYDLPDPVQFAKDIASCLHPEGLWTLEQSYILTMLEKNSFDTICHEHLEYYGLKQIKRIMDEAKLKIIDIKFNDCNGGSFRVYVAHQSNTNFHECVDLIYEIFMNESKLMENETYKNFMDRCDIEMQKLNLLIETIHKNNQKIYIYGASTKGNTLLQYAKINNQQIPYAVERNPLKYGRFTPGTNIQIISEEEMRDHPPEYLLVLPWHFRNEIIQRESKFLENGGKLIFPLPKLEIFSTNENLLITGITGQLGTCAKKNL